MKDDPKQYLSDDDLVLLYYGEHGTPGLAARVAADPELTERYERLSRTLAMTDAWQPPPRDDDYGADVWLRLSPRLEGGRDRRTMPTGRWWARLARPRFSFAGVAGLVLVATAAFLLGRSVQPPALTPAGGTPGVVTATADLDSARLLQGSVARHLEEVNRVLTEFAYDGETGADTESESGWADDMLAANRLYRRTAEHRGERRLAILLADLEPLLIEMAYGTHSTSPTARARMQDEARDELLFKVRVTKQQLGNPSISL